MTAPPRHHCRVFGSPWEGVYGTHIDSARHYGRHWHGVYGLGLLEDGAQRSASGRGRVDAYAGDVITTNPGEVHDGQPLGSTSRRWRMVYLDPSVMAAMVSDLEPAGQLDVALARPVIQDPLLHQTLRRLLDRLDTLHAKQTPPGASCADNLACEELLVQTCALVLNRHAAAGPGQASGEAFGAGVPQAIAQVRDCLADDPLEPPTLTELAQRAGLSKYQLLRRFEKAYGVTPHAWLLLQRAERARGLIRGGASLAGAAASSGFADQSHMTRLFARQFGFTPGAWQKAAATKARCPQ